MQFCGLLLFMIRRIRFLAVLSSICCAAGLYADDAGSNQVVSSSRVLSANDVIAVTVYQEEDLATKTIIDKNGMVMLPLLGQVKISGMTVADATSRIQELYNKDYLVNPQVNLIVEHFAERHFAVLGQVQKPGNIEFPQNESVSLLEAIAMAGGYTRLGSPSKVDVSRIENGKRTIIPVDAGKMAKDPSRKPFEVLPDDVITVGERTF